MPPSSVPLPSPLLGRDVASGLGNLFRGPKMALVCNGNNSPSYIMYPGTLSIKTTSQM